METIHCQQCGGESPSDARFCIECGADMMAASGPTTRLAVERCPGCGFENPPKARFCAACGRSFSISGVLSRPAQVFLRIEPVHSPVAVVIPRQRTHSQHGSGKRRKGNSGGISAIILLGGILVLMFTGSYFWPGILLVVAASILASKITSGHPEEGLMPVLWLGGLAFLFATNQMWPGILALIFLSMALKSGQRWHHGKASR